PLATLARGYSVTRTTQGELVRQSAQVKPGDTLVTQLMDGKILSTVNSR
ncbi:exodeoxyribonuclease VII large subunit, partial [Klebsiella pneumoniae]